MRARPVTGERLREAERSGIDMLRIVRGTLLANLRSGRVPMTPALAAELDAFERELDSARLPSRPTPHGPPALRVVDGGR